VLVQDHSNTFNHLPASYFLNKDSRVPDPATLTADPEDLAWFAEIGLALEAQPTQKVIDLILKKAGFGFLSFGKREGTLHATLMGHDGRSSKTFNFEVTKRTGKGRLEVEIVPIREAPPVIRR